MPCLCPVCAGGLCALVQWACGHTYPMIYVCLWTISRFMGLFCASDLSVPGAHTVPKTKQISESIRDQVPWRGNFPIIRGNDPSFRESPVNFPSGGIPPLYFWKSALFLGQCRRYIPSARMTYNKSAFGLNEPVTRVCHGHMHMFVTIRPLYVHIPVARYANDL